jgi:hypothetical protein
MRTLRSTHALAGLCLLVAFAISGCTLYLGPDDEDRDDDGWCRGSRCDRPTPHPTCDADYECAAGCYCTDSIPKDGVDGICVESGYCKDAKDCGAGMTCDQGTCRPTDRGCKIDSQCPEGSTCDEAHATCVPNDCGGKCPEGTACDAITNTCVPTTCTNDNECPPGAYCDEASGKCIPSTTCSNDGECPGGYCDEPRKTCVPGPDPNAPTCGREVTCNLTARCPADQVPLVNPDGCYSNPPVCVPYAECGQSPPPCEALNTQNACNAFAKECKPVTVGRDCHLPDGKDCVPGSNECVCRQNVFSYCTDR